MFSLTIDNPSVIERYAMAGEVLQRETTNWLVDMAMWMKADLKNRVPVKTGQLKNSIRYEIAHTAAGGEATFHADAQSKDGGYYYGKLLDEGVKPFTIQAKAKPLAFEPGGTKWFAMNVKHPGIKARNFTMDTLEGAIGEADRQADEIADRVFKAVIE